ncbi:hypothetical protein DM860_010199 [Cuscuta australis]|uniref:peptidylprolyl isomerase n=1 Tax=Cuscuta australis TaxID=267555 RepID=A0A328D6Q2_9ASTE|nr:hypothetical protein DM860_010199 [Cuscuta australis]
MASSFTPHPLLSFSHPPSTPPPKALIAAPPPQPPTGSPPEHQQPIVQIGIGGSNKRGGRRGGGSARISGVGSTDWVASSLTRRFGLGAGLAWAGFLALGVISEQVKTRLEVSNQQANAWDVEEEEEVVLPNRIRYSELRVGGGVVPRRGDLVVVDLKGSIKGAIGEEFVDTFGEKKKPLALVMGSRPYTRGMCEGIECVLKTMKRGGKRRVIVPHKLGFGEKGADFGNGVEVPPLATLEYIVEVEKVSLAPA